jgi:hypothetical protein
VETCTSCGCKEQRLRPSHVENVVLLRSCSWILGLYRVVFAVAEKCPRPRDEVGMTSRTDGLCAEVHDSWGPTSLLRQVEDSLSRASNLTCSLVCSLRGQRYAVFNHNLSLLADKPQHPQQSSAPSYAHQQQRAAHPPSEGLQQSTTHHPDPPLNPPRPRSQIEAMPPFGPPQTPATFFTPVYDSAIRHPVFFTQNLKKPPFPIPQVASQGWNPVASGYVMEQRRVQVTGKTKL